MKAFYNIFKVICKFFCQIHFWCNYLIIFKNDYFFIHENFLSKVRLDSFPEMLLICSFFLVEIIIEILLWFLEKSQELHPNWLSGQLNFLSLLERRVCAMVSLRNSLFIDAVWLHLIYFSFSGTWNFKSFEAINLNLSSSLGWTFWKDNSVKGLS